MTNSAADDGAVAVATMAADGLYRATVLRDGGRELHLFSSMARSYRLFDGLPATASGGGYFRQHP